MGYQRLHLKSFAAQHQLLVIDQSVLRDRQKLAIEVWVVGAVQQVAPVENRTKRCLCKGQGRGSGASLPLCPVDFNEERPRTRHRQLGVLASDRLGILSMCASAA